MADASAPLDAARLSTAQLVVEHHAALYRYAYRLTGSTADAEDLTQQTFLVAQQKLGQVRDSGCAQAWLFTVLRNCYAKSFRGRLPLGATTLDINDIPDEINEQDVDSDQLQLAINQLPNEFKVVVLLFYFEERSYREIAEVLAIPIGTVMSRLARAKAQLRRLLDVGLRSQHRPAAVRASDLHVWSKSVAIKP